MELKKITPQPFLSPARGPIYFPAYYLENLFLDSLPYFSYNQTVWKRGAKITSSAGGKSSKGCDSFSWNRNSWK
jgi:hypothetical protein